MKKVITTIIGFIIFISCAPQKTTTYKVERQFNLSYFDLTKYSQKDFFISEGEYFLKYTPIGIFDYNISPSKEVYYELFKQPYSTYTVEDTIIKKVVPIEKICIDDLLDSVYNIGVSKGANGISKLRFEIDESKGVYSVKGLYIKREN